MELHEKLQMLRKQRGLTQEELAEKLYVSRTAISKWESGRGHPSIESLKMIAEFFGVTVDELIRSGELVTLAETENREKRQNGLYLVCGLLDCLTALLWVLPLFGQRTAEGIRSLPLCLLSGVNPAVKVAMMALLALSVVNGIAAVIICHLDRPQLWSRHRLVTGLALSLIETVFFMLAKQPYSGIFCLTVLLIKAFFVYQNR